MWDEFEQFKNNKRNRPNTTSLWTPYTIKHFAGVDICVHVSRNGTFPEEWARLSGQHKSALRKRLHRHGLGFKSFHKHCVIILINCSEFLQQIRCKNCASDRTKTKLRRAHNVHSGLEKTAKKIYPLAPCQQQVQGNPSRFGFLCNQGCFCTSAKYIECDLYI